MQINITAVNRCAIRSQCGDIAAHFRGFTQQDIQRHINRLIIKMAVIQDQVTLFCRLTNHGIRRALALTECLKQR